jgi:hypothetical protein
VGDPEATSQYRLKSDAFAKRPSQQLGHAGDHFVEVEDTRRERRLARESQKALGKGGRSRSTGASVLQVLFNVGLAAPKAAAGDVEATDHNREHIIEVVGDASGKLAHRFHLLGLTQRVLGAG